MFTYLQKIYTQLLTSGISEDNSTMQNNKVKTLNAMIILGVFVITPIILSVKLYLAEYKHVIGIVLFTCFLVFYLLRKESNKIDRYYPFIGTACLMVSVAISFFSFKVTGAPYVILIVAFMTTILVESRKVKTLFLVLCFFTFTTTNYFQLKYKPFDDIEYGFMIIMYLIIFIAMNYFDRLSIQYQSIIEGKNIQLAASNELIQKQTTELVLLQEEKHEEELTQKQKDLDSVLANNRMQLKIRQNILDQIKEVREESEALKILKSLKMDLRSQIETQQKIEFSEDNIHEINAEFYKRLLAAHPKVSKKERELCSYIKLGLSTKEIAALIGTSENTIYVTKNRLKAKLGFKNSSDVDGYIISF